MLEGALPSFEMQAGNRGKAAARVRLLRELEPENQEIERIAAQLTAGGGR